VMAALISVTLMDQSLGCAADSVKHLLGGD